jgi:hypothetical protein
MVLCLCLCLVATQLGMLQDSPEDYTQHLKKSSQSVFPSPSLLISKVQNESQVVYNPCHCFGS